MDRIAEPLPPPADSLAVAAGPPAAPAAVATIANQDPASESEVRDPVLADLDGWVRESPPWLLSAVVHFAALILLALWWSATQVETPLMLDADFAEDLGEQLVEEPFELDTAVDETFEEQVFSPTILPPVENPLAAPVMAEVSPFGFSPASDQAAPVVGIALSGREPGMRQALLKAYGGTAKTETAVLAGLEWLARQQKRSGEWSLRGPYKDGSPNYENQEAATAMALLAFQGRGYTTRGNERDKFTGVVQRGWRWLLRRQDGDGCFFRGRVRNHRFYTHAQATIALCELFGMTRDEEYREPAQKAINYLVRTQSSKGGWKYEPGVGSDLSVTGWVVMALQSARMAGLDVPSPVFDGVTRFLNTVQRESGSQYSYQPREGPKLAMTAEGLLCRQYLGWQHEDPRLEDGASLLIRNPVKWGRSRNTYYWYYATQVCHHMEGEWWQKWNAVMRQVLPENQVSSGRDRGSWDPGDGTWDASAGRLYTTCLSIYCLEVYYRHLPIYRRGLLSGELLE